LKGAILFSSKELLEGVKNKKKIKFFQKIAKTA
jgi:hypothetical protein